MLYLNMKRFFLTKLIIDNDYFYTVLMFINRGIIPLKVVRLYLFHKKQP